ncbi:MAG: UvrB/UvrC motif-containing protein [Planctomycetota bacterium]|jgi:protein arginine kinase activator|nr:UvrB/UvrC motif-containing protein [Planctomycetota bacterium]
MYICQICKKNPATIHLTDIHNNVKKEVHLCAGCAAEKGFNMQSAASLPQLLGIKAKKQSTEEPRPNRFAPEEDIICPKCGYRWSDFKNKGRLGCSEDYHAFREKLRPLIANQLSATPIGPGPLHRGKYPGKKSSVDPVTREIRNLELDLRRAVDEERYEDAARIKSELRELRGYAGTPAKAADKTELN